MRSRTKVVGLQPNLEVGVQLKAMLKMAIKADKLGS